MTNRSELTVFLFCAPNPGCSAPACSRLLRPSRLELCREATGCLGLLGCGSSDVVSLARLAQMQQAKRLSLAEPQPSKVRASATSAAYFLAAAMPAALLISCLVPCVRRLNLS